MDKAKKSRFESLAAAVGQIAQVNLALPLGSAGISPALAEQKLLHNRWNWPILLDLAGVVVASVPARRRRVQTRGLLSVTLASRQRLHG